MHACRLILAVLTLCAVASSVSAQPAPPPEPRVVSRESIAAAPGRKVERYAKPALAPDETGYVLMASLGSEGKLPTVVELVSFDRAGKTTGRHTIASFSTDDFWLFRTRLLVLPSGELLVATPDRNLAGVPGRGGLLRLSAGGKVLHRAPLHPPHDAYDPSAENKFDIVGLAATSDCNVVVGGRASARTAGGGRSSRRTACAWPSRAQSSSFCRPSMPCRPRPTAAS